MGLGALKSAVKALVPRAGLDFVTAGAAAGAAP